MAIIAIAIGAIAASAAAAISAVVVTIASVVAATIAPVIATVGAIVSTVMTAIAPAVSAVLSTIGSVAGSIVSTVGSALSGAVATIKETVGPVIAGLNEAIAGIVTAITEPLAPVLNPIKEGLEAINAELTLIDTAVTETLGPIQETVELITRVGSIKILYDMITGQQDVLTGLKKISEDQQLGTMQSIAALSQQIITTGINIMNKVDDQVSIVAATVDTFDERLISSIDELRMELNAELIATVTPVRLSLGKTGESLSHAIAGVYGKLEDTGWFASMLLRVLP